MSSVALIFGSAALGTALADVGVAVPAGEDWSIQFVRAANIHATSSALVDVVLTDDTSTFYLARNVAVAAGQAVNIVGPEAFKLPSGWRLRARASAAARIDLTVSGTKRSAA